MVGIATYDAIFMTEGDISKNHANTCKTTSIPVPAHYSLISYRPTSSSAYHAKQRAKVKWPYRHVGTRREEDHGRIALHLFMWQQLAHHTTPLHCVAFSFRLTEVAFVTPMVISR